MDRQSLLNLGKRYQQHLQGYPTRPIGRPTRFGGMRDDRRRRIQTRWDQRRCQRLDRKVRAGIVEEARSFVYGSSLAVQEELVGYTEQRAPDVARLVRIEGEKTLAAGRFDGDAVWKSAVFEWLVSHFAQEACNERMERETAQAMGPSRRPGRL